MSPSGPPPPSPNVQMVFQDPLAALNAAMDRGATIIGEPLILYP